MNEVNGKHIIQSLQKRWNLQLLVAYLLFAVAATVLLSAIAMRIIGVSWTALPIIFIIAIASIYYLFVKKINEHDVARFLNQAFPQLQESTNLLLQPSGALSRLEQLQVKRIENYLNKNIPVPQLIKKKISTALILLAASILFAFLLFIIPLQSAHSASLIPNSNAAVYTGKPEQKLAAIKEVSVNIAPPAYTGKKARTQHLFNIVAEQKAAVNWSITTTKPATTLQFVFNDKSVLNLQPLNKEHTQWTAKKTILQTGFYQVNIDKQTSELYKIEMIKDEVPVITVQSPKPSTMIDFGEPKRVMIDVAVADDYGIDSATIQATTASGSGEAVKFKELQFFFAGFRSGGKQYHMQKRLDLPALGMQAGDELYFYIKATDNNRQEKRSDVYIVRLADTAQLMSMAGLASGVDIKPEFFRSERQIIIETEQLLKDKDTMSTEAFNKKSSELGVDQKLLRLRYGKFLGEESETEIGEDHNKHEEHNDAADFGNAEKILDQFSHKHDIAEDATFFDDATKKQLKATLDEMWKAELQLRTYKPKDALPFEYKALRLLKDLQQQTRSYVAKTGVKTTPLNPAKRLTGELNEIKEPVTTETAKQKDSAVMVLRKSIGILEQLKNGEALQQNDKQILEQASARLSAEAASNPSLYITSYQALIRVLDKKAKSGDITLAGNALQKLIQPVAPMPQQSATAPDMNLSQRYFMNLNKHHD